MKQFFCDIIVAVGIFERQVELVGFLQHSPTVLVALVTFQPTTASIDVDPDISAIENINQWHKRKHIEKKVITHSVMRGFPLNKDRLIHIKMKVSATQLHVPTIF
jgi:hypothetical protein